MFGQPAHVSQDIGRFLDMENLILLFLISKFVTIPYMSPSQNNTIRGRLKHRRFKSDWFIKNVETLILIRSHSIDEKA